MSSLTIRAAVDADLEAICAIYNESIPRRNATADLEPQSIDARRAWFVNRDHATRPVLVAEDGLGVCAWGSYTNFKDRSAYAPTAEVSVYVADRATGRGRPTTLSARCAKPATGWGVNAACSSWKATCWR
ncbi:MAG: N-acetyltransferase family protein [Planctomycetota bacterium]